MKAETKGNFVVVSKKFYAGGEVVTELLLNDPEIHCQVIFNDKKGNYDFFELGKEYIVDFIKREAE